jgi:hypothetical protein
MNGQWWRLLLIGSDEEEKRTGSEGESWCRFHCALMVPLEEGREEQETRRKGAEEAERFECKRGAAAAHRQRTGACWCKAELGEGDPIYLPEGE